MIYDISKNNPLVGQFMSELRDENIQRDRQRFRRNLERLGEIFAYRISEKMNSHTQNVNTPLGIASCVVLAEQPILATILRAGLPLHNGLLNYFDQADSAFVSAYRKHDKSGEFTIQMEYLSCTNIEDRTLIIADPMLATGSSMALTIRELQEYGRPKHIHVVTVVACAEGIKQVKKCFSNLDIWTAGIDEELTAKGYIVPGLGDAGDLAYGEKLQD